MSSSTSYTSYPPLSLQLPAMHAPAPQYPPLDEFSLLPSPSSFFAPAYQPAPATPPHFAHSDSENDADLSGSEDHASPATSFVATPVGSPTLQPILAPNPVAPYKANVDLMANFSLTNYDNHDEAYAVPYSSTQQTTAVQHSYLPYTAASTTPPAPVAAPVAAPVEQTLPPAHSQNTVAAFQQFAAPPQPANSASSSSFPMVQGMPQGIPIMAMGPNGVPMMMMALPQSAFAHFQGFAASAPAPVAPVAAPVPVPAPQQQHLQSFEAAGGTYYFVPNAASTGSSAASSADEDESPERKVFESLVGKSKKSSFGKDQVKRFICPQPDCGRAFARNFNMQSHLKSHLGIRDFSCPVCPKKFSRRHDRARHCAAVHDIHEESPVKRPGHLGHAHSHSISSQEEFV
ncbi:zinc finger, C2H5-type domain containing protein [Pseudohyphozyma bogoriensis]|nr:zinc finger, C2H5-type domain containing protein [Pseudohyphozyma bogoriensis]